MKDRPGFMFFYDKWEDIVVSSDEVLATFVRAAYDYSRYGQEPNFTAGYKLMWQQIRKSIDKSADRYSEISSSRRYSRYCGIEKTAGRTPMEYDEWKRMVSSEDES